MGNSLRRRPVLPRQREKVDGSNPSPCLGLVAQWKSALGSLHGARSAWVAPISSRLGYRRGRPLVRIQPQSINMELTADDVDQIEEVRQLVEGLIEMAASDEDGVLDEKNLIILEAQLDGLHQALSLAVAQREGMLDE